jgi:hypothetical protein
MIFNFAKFSIFTIFELLLLSMIFHFRNRGGKNRAPTFFLQSQFLAAILLRSDQKLGAWGRWFWQQKLKIALAAAAFLQ